MLGHPSRKEPCPSSSPASSPAHGGSRGWKHCAALSGGMKQPFGTKSAGIHEISWQLGTGRDSTRSPTGRDRARTSVPSERDSKNSRRSRGLLPSPSGMGSCLHPWREAANCCLTSSRSLPEPSRGAAYCSQQLREAKLRQGGAGLSRQLTGCTPLPIDGKRGRGWGGHTHLPWGHWWGEG